MAVDYKFRDTAPKNRRLDRRIPACLPAMAGGVPALVTNISVSDCAFIAEDADLEPSDVIRITLDGQIALEATILRRWSRDHYAAAFVALTPAAIHAIEHLESDLLRGHREDEAPDYSPKASSAEV